VSAVNAHEVAPVLRERAMNPTTATPRTFPWPDPNCPKNQAKLPVAEYLRYAGQHVAWSWDGTRILACADTLTALIAELCRLSINTETVVFGFVDTDSNLGGLECL